MLHIQQSQLQTPIFKSNNCASLDMKLWTLGLKFWNICRVGRICYFTTICESVWKTNRFHSIVSTVANQAFQKYFFPYVLLQLLLISRWVTRSLRVQLNLCGVPSPPNKFFPDPQNLQDWRTANFFPDVAPLIRRNQWAVLLLTKAFAAFDFVSPCFYTTYKTITFCRREKWTKLFRLWTEKEGVGHYNDDDYVLVWKRRIYSGRV